MFNKRSTPKVRRNAGRGKMQKNLLAAFRDDLELVPPGETDVKVLKDDNLDAVAAEFPGFRVKNCRVARKYMYLTIETARMRVGHGMRLAGDWEDEILDVACTKESMRRGRREGGIEWGYGPMVRLLTQYIGKPWTEARGRIMNRVRDKGMLREDTARTLENLVRVNVIVTDEGVHDFERGLLGSRPNDGRRFYVDDAGLLRKVPCPKKETKPAATPLYEQVFVAELERHVKIDGRWCQVLLAPIQILAELASPGQLPFITADGRWMEEAAAGAKMWKPRGPQDEILKQEAAIDPDYAYKSADHIQLWGGKFYAVSRRQLGNRELKAHRLVNDVLPGRKKVRQSVYSTC